MSDRSEIAASSPVALGGRACDRPRDNEGCRGGFRLEPRIFGTDAHHEGRRGWLRSAETISERGTRPTLSRIQREPGMRELPRYGEASDAELAAWSVGGDRRAFDEIVSRHGPFALRVASRLVRDATTAEDLAQDAMFRAWKDIGRFDAKRAQFTTWLYQIVVNLCIDHQRKRRPGQLPENFDAIDAKPGADSMIETSERNAAMAKAITELSPGQRAAMVLVYDEEMSGSEAARVLGLSAKAVERLLARARAYLRDRLRADHGWKES